MVSPLGKKPLVTFLSLWGASCGRSGAGERVLFDILPQWGFRRSIGETMAGSVAPLQTQASVNDARELFRSFVKEGLRRKSVKDRDQNSERMVGVR